MTVRLKSCQVSEVAETALVSGQRGQFQQLLKTRVILILDFTRLHAIIYTNYVPLSPVTITYSYYYYYYYYYYIIINIIIIMLNLRGLNRRPAMPPTRLG